MPSFRVETTVDFSITADTEQEAKDAVDTALANCDGAALANWIAGHEVLSATNEEE